MLQTIDKLLGAIRTDPEMEKTLVFLNDGYVHQNQRRQEHLASLRLPIEGKSVLELGAGIGEHTGFFLDRKCHVTVTDVRPENLRAFALRYPDVLNYLLDLETAHADSSVQHDIVFAYGLLYHISDPARAIALFSAWCGDLMLMETCVSFGDGFEIHPIEEDRNNAVQAMSGLGCRPTRAWVFRELQRHFAHVYVPITQPPHYDFPTDWTNPGARTPGLPHRAIFIASRTPIDNPWLLDHLPDHQRI